MAAAVIATVGSCSRFHLPYRTLPRPPLPPGQTAPDCGSSPRNHAPGACLPHPSVERDASITATRQGPDFSNNDPPPSSAWRAIGAHNAFAIFKLNEGTGFVDGTAGTMIQLARSVGLVVGGYDFLHVCGADPASEAHAFSRLVIAYRLTFIFADAEYGGSGCNARAWMTTWYQTVQHDTHILPGTYTGAWWWQPHLGAWWYGGSSGGSIAWISGYGVRYPYMPSGRTRLDMWQFSDAGWNGATTADLSVWRDGVAAFVNATHSAPVGVRCFGPGAKVRDKRCAQIRLRVARLSRERTRRNSEITYIRRRLIETGCRTKRGHDVPHPAAYCEGFRAVGDYDHARIRQINAFTHRATIARY